MNMMASSARPMSSGSRPSTSNSTRADQTHEPKEIWSNLLKSVSSHKSIPSRNLLVMGISHLHDDSKRRRWDKGDQ